MKTKLLTILATVFLSQGCSTLKRSLVAGALAGATTGVFAGAMARPTGKKDNAAKGALVGGALGLAAGWFVHEKAQRRDERTRRELLLNLEKFGVGGVPKADGGGNPALAKPVVDSEWVETRVEGNKLIEAHRVWVIKENSRWIPKDADDDEGGGR